MTHIIFNILNLFSDHTFLVVTIGCLFLSMSCGIVGTFLVLKKESL